MRLEFAFISSLEKYTTMLCIDRVNYKRWLPLYFENCLALQDKFPAIYGSFMAGGFFGRHNKRKASAVPMVQTLEKAYNKSAKSNSGIVGFSQRKDVVCRWNIIKHEKVKLNNCR